MDFQYIDFEMLKYSQSLYRLPITIFQRPTQPLVSVTPVLKCARRLVMNDPNLSGNYHTIVRYFLSKKILRTFFFQKMLSQ